MFICNLDVADFIEYRPPNEINIVRVNRDEEWLKENLKKLEMFWKEVEFYRVNDIKKHPKFPNKKKVLDLTNYDSDDDSELFKEINIIETGNEKKCKEFIPNIFSIIDC